MYSLYALALGYLLGSVPFGLILTNLFGEGNLRQIGSGNIGATNVLRTGNKGLAAATLLLDGAKGFLAVWLAWRWWPEVAGYAALGAVLGHCFPVWLRFKGGKGVATTLGVTLALATPIGLTYAATWLVMLAATRISSLSGMTAALAAPVAAWFSGNQAFVPVLAAIAALVLWLHRANIARLRAGTEPKVGQKS
ncbi:MULTISPECIES: glycerol-3-phosphate 1-O-acyltransferase PlsY [unclassified Novosphingobium]|uniref:glycerol-3-phosphate 1-O-acyltransferase PlsY n=1 Tax=unclassified Novosphingobium TaxID=2644732 RepID=UPI0025F81356|nr:MULTISPECIES: glycerol-3-phosphate 1-O-acyltransferase PlsY [unclassified Novosphingobium]HQV02965.1 glycerol-3-phosphate 1-O-acyltransferase PlsY [Novosphingobium sp.]